METRLFKSYNYIAIQNVQTIITHNYPHQNLFQKWRSENYKIGLIKRIVNNVINTLQGYFIDHFKTIEYQTIQTCITLSMIPKDPYKGLKYQNVILGYHKTIN